MKNCHILALLVSALLSLNLCAQSFGQSQLSELERCQIVANSYCPAIERVAENEQGRIFLLLKSGKKLFCSDYDQWDLGVKDDYLAQLERVDPSDILEQAYPFSVDFENPLGEQVFSSHITLPITDENYSPGRLRNDELSKATYGLTKHDVKRNLRAVSFLGKKVYFNSVNGAANALEKVEREFKARGLSSKLKSVRDYAGTFVHRLISGTNRLSSHSFGTAIDLTPKDKNLATYWKWSARCRNDIDHCNQSQESDLEIVAPRNFDHFRVPGEKMLYDVVSIFEKHGFIWGGKWHHFDTMHFEFRPEFMGGNVDCGF